MTVRLPAKKRIHPIGLAATVVLYAVACFLLALHDDPSHRRLTAPKPLVITMRGHDCLLCIPFVCFTLAWWANPAYFAGLIAAWRGHWRASLVLATLAVLAASTILVDFPVYVKHYPGTIVVTDRIV